ncbi:MAG TPA: hypothetical protein VFQ07_05995 [Candidatus Polarisedimenticolia bacterium]|nr:hypothetical protein [Candidatus Polarisedimenticolia bacterium]
MELDELQRRWREQDAKLDAVLRLQARLVAEPSRRRAASSLRRAAWAWGLEAAVSFLVVVWLASFAADHLFEPRFYIPAAWLALGAMLLVITGARQVVELWTIDPGLPVLAIQKRLERLRISRARTLKWTLLLSPLAWTPMCLVGLRALLGFDAYSHLDPAYLWGNLLVGLAVIPIGYGIARWLSARVHRSPLLRAVLDDVGGRSFARASRFLAAAEALENDPLREGEA